MILETMWGVLHYSLTGGEGIFDCRRQHSVTDSGFTAWRVVGGTCRVSEHRRRIGLRG